MPYIFAKTNLYFCESAVYQKGQKRTQKLVVLKIFSSAFKIIDRRGQNSYLLKQHEMRIVHDPDNVLEL